METHFFFGSNTHRGFFGGYGHIVKADKLIILKGGAGSGKSTLIKKVAEFATECGYMAELFHCSSDSKSLDAVNLPSLNAAVVDGTAPHVIEASSPLTHHYVFNLLDAANYKRIYEHEPLLENCQFYKKQYFTNAYANLKCAHELQTNLDAQISPYLDEVKLLGLASNVLSLIEGTPLDETQRRFVSAITDKGYLDYYHNNFSGLNRLTFDYEFEVQFQTLLNRLKRLLNEKQINYFEFVNPFVTEQPEALQVGECIIAPHRVFPDTLSTFDLSLALKSFNRHFVQSDTPVIENLISRAVENLTFARISHAEIEKLYLPVMDWEDVNRKTERIINLIFN